MRKPLASAAAFGAALTLYPGAASAELDPIQTNEAQIVSLDTMTTLPQDPTDLSVVIVGETVEVVAVDTADAVVDSTASETAVEAFTSEQPVQSTDGVSEAVVSAEEPAVTEAAVATEVTTVEVAEAEEQISDGGPELDVTREQVTILDSLYLDTSEDYEISGQTVNNHSVWTNEGYGEALAEDCEANDPTCGNNVVYTIGKNNTIVHVVSNVEGSSGKVTEFKFTITAAELQRIAELEGIPAGQLIEIVASLHFEKGSSMESSDLESVIITKEPVTIDQPEAPEAPVAPTPTPVEITDVVTPVFTPEQPPATEQPAVEPPVLTPAKEDVLPVTGTHTSRIAALGATIVGMGISMAAVGRRGGGQPLRATSLHNPLSRIGRIAGLDDDSENLED